MSHAVRKQQAKLTWNTAGSTMKDREWLKQKLCTALGWDGVVVEGVVEAIDNASATQEIDTIVQVNSFLACACMS